MKIKMNEPVKRKIMVEIEIHTDSTDHLQNLENEALQAVLPSPIENHDGKVQFTGSRYVQDNGRE